METEYNIAVVWQPQLPQTEREAEEIVSFLSINGANSIACPLNSPDFRKQVSGDDFDLVICLGGDGSMLRAGKLCAAHEIPVMGINMGSVGFLIETQQGEWRQNIDKLLTGAWSPEKRMLLTVEAERNGESILRTEVLNEAVIARGKELRPVRLAASINGIPLTSYCADGLIISTATGSTAYAMSVGGPILQPEMRNMLLIPIAPYLCSDRCLVLSDTDEVTIDVSGEVETLLSPDGRDHLQLQAGDRVRVRASEHSAVFVRFNPKETIYRKLISK